LLLRHFSSLAHNRSYVATVLKYVWLLLAGAALYSANAIVFGVTLAPKIFGPQYLVEVRWMILGAAWTSLYVMTQGFFAALRAREQSNRVLFTYILVLGVMAAMLPLIAGSGVTAILAAQTIAWGFAVPLAGVFVLLARPIQARPSQGGNRPAGAASESAASPARSRS
jgi:hypothetical protein